MIHPREQRIDDKIDQANEFARPILSYLRELVHKACPEVKETIKWGMPAFDYKGVYCVMAAFQKHCAFNIWKAKLLNDPQHYLGERANNGGEGMGHLGRITSLEDLPPEDVMLDFLIQAKALNEQGVKLKPEAKTKKKAAPAMDPEFMKALEADKKALEHYTAFSPSQKKDYIEWVTEAKTDSTRSKRILTALEWISEGKTRLWKYQK